MADPPDREAQTVRPRGERGRRRAALIAALLLSSGVIALWAERRPIARRYIDGLLSERGVPARYTLADIGPTRQRLTDVAIGDPAHPDFAADWIEIDTRIGLSGASITDLRVGHAALRGRIVDGKFDWGAVDRLLPTPSGKPFVLPTIHADIADLRLGLATPQGAVAVRLSGRGGLDNGFSGRAALDAATLRTGDCRADGIGAQGKIRVTAGRPSFSGPVSIGTAACAGAVARGMTATIDATLAPALDQWRGHATLGVTAFRHPAGRLDDTHGTIDFAGSAAATTGAIALGTGPFAANGIAGKALSVRGSYRIAGDTPAFTGTIGAQAARLSSSTIATLAGARQTGTGTPLAPIIRQIATAATVAARGFDVTADIAATGQGATVSGARFTSASGLRARFAGGDGVRYRWANRVPSIDGTLRSGGGGLPQMVVRMRQASATAPLSGRAQIARYAVDGASLALGTVAFTRAASGALRVATTARLSGPIGSGRIDGLSLPIDLRWDGGGRLLIGPTCTELGFDRLALQGFALRPGRTTLCPTGGALFRLDRGRIGGGMTIAPITLHGTLGTAPITLATAGGTLALGIRTGRLGKIAVVVGDGERTTRLDIAGLDAAMTGGDLSGRFTGGSGGIAHVPLLLSAASGGWRLERGALHMTGAMAVADADADPRFKPLDAQDVSLTLVDGRIAATGTLAVPVKNIEVARVTIAHDLAHGTGRAHLAVPGIAFGPRLQPDDLTRLTFGVIADVAGTVSGDGHIRWNPGGVTSDGVFRTAGTDLAAALGPVTGIAGEIRFTDLLALQSAPGQTVTIKGINPGFAVNDGTIRYHTLDSRRVQIEEGRWPFAGGELRLAPTLLDFGDQRERRTTFTVTGMKAAEFLQQFDFKNLDATGIFDGTLPIAFDASGGRIDHGRLVARPGGGTIAYVGEVSQKDLGFWGNFAFQALKSLRYRDLDIVMNGPLAGEIITEVRFAGLGQGVGAKRNFLFDRLQKLPFVFNVRVAAPFRQLIDSAASFYDPKRLIDRNLPALIEEQNRRAAPTSIQPPDSRKMP